MSLKQSSSSPSLSTTLSLHDGVQNNFHSSLSREDAPSEERHPVPGNHPTVQEPPNPKASREPPPTKKPVSAPYVEIESGSYRSRLTAAAAAATATLPTCPGRTTHGTVLRPSLPRSLLRAADERAAFGRGAAPRTPPCALPIYTPLLSPLYATLPSVQAVVFYIALRDCSSCQLANRLEISALR